MKLSSKEIYMLSDGLLALIKNASEAIKLTNNEHAQCAISGDIHKYQSLNSKLMSILKRQNGLVEVETDSLKKLQKGFVLDNDDVLYDLIETYYPQEMGLDFILKLKGVSQVCLSKELSINKQNIWAWVRGRQAISKKYIPQLEKILGVPRTYFDKQLTAEDKIQIMRIVGGHEDEQNDE